MLAANSLSPLMGQAPDSQHSTFPDKDPNAGKNRQPNSTSLSAIVATLIPTLIIAVLYISSFLSIRRRYSNIYTPRTYFPTLSQKHRTPSTRSGVVNWFAEFWSLDDKFLLQHHSLDGYLFLRFFKIIISICFFGCCLTWPILFPVNATGGGNATQLDRISFSNIKGTDRLYAHTVIAWVFLGIVMVIIARERMFLIDLRDAYLLSKENTARLSSRTVLFVSVPKDALQEELVHRVFGDGVKRTWPISDLDDLESLTDKRNKAAMNLEEEQVLLAIKVNSRKLNASKATGTNGTMSDSAGQQGHDDLRPKHRSKVLIGEKRDTIEYLRQELSTLSQDVSAARELHGTKKPSRYHAVFVEYETQTDAQKALQTVRYHLPLHLEERYVGMQPKDVLWKNLRVHMAGRIMYGYIAAALVVAIVIFWSIPVAFVGAISNVNYLTNKVKFLRFIKDLPAPVLGLITGPLPPFLTSLFVSYVPYFFRYIAKLSGEPTTALAELKTQTYYLIFQVVQVFLVTTFSSGAAAVVTLIIVSPTMVPDLLASSLPKASNFYLSYFLLQGFYNAPKNILNLSDLAMYLFYDKFIDKTPRQKYNRYLQFKGIGWGSVYPKFTNFAIIAIAYSIIAPLVLGFACIGLSLFYLSYRYNLFFVIETKVDTKGECYRRALQHILIGVYLSELCLIGLFSARGAPGPSALMLLLLLATVTSHATMNRILEPLEKHMPAGIASEEDQMEGEDAPLLAAEEGESGDYPGPARQPPASRSRIMREFDGTLPSWILKPLAKLFEPQVFESPNVLRAWMRDRGDGDEDDDSEVPIYSEDEVNHSYLNPVLTSKTPTLWLVRDEAGVSVWEMEENEKLGISSTDEGAVLDQNNKIRWDLEGAPIFKMPVRY